MDTAELLFRMIMRVNPEEFRWQESHYDHDSGLGRELLFLVANHEWVRATSEVVDISRSDVVETTIKIDIDLSQITHEAFRKRTGRLWLPVAVLPPQTGERQLEPDPFTTVTDAAGNLLPLLAADDLRHQMSAALAEIIVNMAVAHLAAPANEARGASGGDERAEMPRVATRDQRVLLSAAIYRVLRRGLGPGIDPPEAEPVLATSRITAARNGLLELISPYMVFLEQRAKKITPRAQFAPEVAQRAVIVLQALTESLIVVVPVDHDTAPTVLTVRVPARILVPASDLVKRLNPKTWLIRPSGHLAIGVLLPTSDADRQIQLHLPDGVTFEEPTRVTIEEPASTDSQPEKPSGKRRVTQTLLPRLDIAVRNPPPLQDLAASMEQIFDPKVHSWPDALVQSLVDLARVKTAAAFDALRHYDVRQSEAEQPPSEADLAAERGAYSRLKELSDRLTPAAAGDDHARASLQEVWEESKRHTLSLFRHTSVERLGPRTVAARIEMIEAVTQRATPKQATVSVDVKVDDRDYLSMARTSTLMSLILMGGILFFLIGWHFINPSNSPAPEVVAIVLTLFATIQASRIERPDRLTLYGQLAAMGNWLVAVSMLPALTLAVALAFKPSGWAPANWTWACSLFEGLLLVLMLRGPLTPAGSPSTAQRGRFSVGQRRTFRTEPLNYSHFEALRSDYWRNTTADALMIGRAAYGYVVWQGIESGPDAEPPLPQLESLLSTREGSVSPGEANSVLALLHSSTLRQAITFVVFREKPDDSWAGDQSTRKKIELDLDPDRLAPMDNITSTIDIFVGVDRGDIPAITKHPLVAIMEAARNKLILLEAQLPVPVPVSYGGDTQWARVRVAVRDTRDIGRITGFLGDIHREMTKLTGLGCILAVQAVPTDPLRLITTGQPGQPGTDGKSTGGRLFAGDLDMSGIEAIESEPAEAPTWRMLTVCADARSNIESDMIRHLPLDGSRFQLAHLNYARLHGTAVMIMLAHARPDGPCAADPRADHRQQHDGITNPEDEQEKPALGQPRILIDEKGSRQQLGPMVQHPLLRVRFRWQDRPGAFLSVLDSVGDVLNRRSPPIVLENRNVSYARLQVESGRIATGYFTFRIHAPAQKETDWISGKTEQMGRKIGALAGLKAVTRQGTGPAGDGVGPPEDPVIHVDFIRKEAPSLRAADTGTASERVQEIDRQAERYEKIWREMPSGTDRSGEMAKIAEQILSLLPVPKLDVVDKLLSPRAGQRLTAYLSLVAEPDAGHGEELIETLTEREGIPCNQNWAFRALSRILDVKGSSWVSPRSVAMLCGMRDGLRPRSDRQRKLASLVDRITRPTGDI